MMRWIVGSSLKLRFLVGLVAVALLLLGFVQLRGMPVETLPEFNPPMVEIQTEALGLSGAEVEQLVTVPLEQDLLNGVAWLERIRSESVPGLSRIELIFQPGTDVLKARQLVQERLIQAPGGIPNVSKAPVVLQPLSSTSRVMMIGLSSRDLSLIDMSVLARWKLRPRLMGVPGVANVAIWGQQERQLQVQVDPEKLRERGVALDQVLQTTANALWVSPLSFTEASTPGTGGFIDTSNQRLGIQHILPIMTAKDLAQVAVEDTGGRVLRLADVSRVVEDHQPLIGGAVASGGPSLMLVVEKFPGANSLEVTREVEAALDEMRPGLAGITIDTGVYRPASFLEAATRELAVALLVGLVLMVALLGAAYLDWRVALIALVTIPLSLVTAALVLYHRGATFNSMVLAGLVIALGVVVDDTIVDTDNLRRRLQQHARLGEMGSESTMAAFLRASLEVRGPLLYATLMVVVAAVPVLFLQGVTGSFVRPLGVSYLLAILASMAVALVVTPALTLLVFGGVPLERRRPPLLRWLQRGCAAVLTRLIFRFRLAYVGIGVIALAGLAVLPQLNGRPMLPAAQDRNLLIHWDAAPGMSRPEMDRITGRAARELRTVPGVRDVGAHLGRAVTSDQVVDVNSAELWVSIDPRADLPRAVAAVRQVVNGYPGLAHSLVAYPEERIRQLRTGENEPVVVRVYGENLQVLRAKADEVARALAGVRGVVAPHVDGQSTQPTVEIETNLAAAQRHAIKPGDVRRAAATLLSGVTVGNLFEEQKVFDVVVWGEPAVRHSLTSIRDMLIDTPAGGRVRLGDVATVRIAPNPTAIQHDAVSRYVDVVAEVRGRSLGAVTHDVEQRVRSIQFPLEHHAEVLGASAERHEGRLRLLSIAVAAAIGILLLLQAAFGSWRLAALVFLTLPLALVGGGLAAIALTRGEMTSLGSFAGFFAVLAIAVRNGVLLLRHYQGLEQEGEEFGAGLVLRGAEDRAAPVALTALTVAVGLLPLLWFGGIGGLDMVRPLAAVLLGGLVTSTVVGLVLLPFLYLQFAPRRRPDSSDPQPQLSSTSR
jgi:CzcA family heavy metal efflux pump